MNRISETDLILNEDGSIYHLNLLPGEIADTIITVGDQDRVPMVSKYFDYIELKKGKREFVTHTGRIGNKRITVISTGIGTDNIDIVLNELDALVNIDFANRKVNPKLRRLNIIRIGTSGAVQPDIPVDSLLASSAAFGFDQLMQYYNYEHSILEKALISTFLTALAEQNYKITPYIASADADLLNQLAGDVNRGITVTAPGFYAPQGRLVRASSTVAGLMDILQNFKSGHYRIANLEMETAGIYGLAANLGHKALSFNIILANRVTRAFSKQPAKIMEHHLQHLLEKLANHSN